MAAWQLWPPLQPRNNPATTSHHNHGRSLLAATVAAAMATMIGLGALRPRAFRYVVWSYHYENSANINSYHHYHHLLPAARHPPPTAHHPPTPTPTTAAAAAVETAPAWAGAWRSGGLTTPPTTKPTTPPAT